VTTPLVARVLLADDHKIVRQGLCAILDRQPDIRVVEQAGDGAEAVKRGLASELDLAILDVSMPKLTGLQAARQLIAHRPALRIVMLSMHDNEQFFEEAKRAGASVACSSRPPTRTWCMRAAPSCGARSSSSRVVPSPPRADRAARPQRGTRSRTASSRSSS